MNANEHTPAAVSGVSGLPIWSERDVVRLSVDDPSAPDGETTVLVMSRMEFSIFVRQYGYSCDFEDLANLSA